MSTELQELSSKAASAVKQVVAVCSPKLKEVTEKVSMISSKLTEVATKVQEVSGKAALTICTPQVKEVKVDEPTVSENLRGA
jgi:hypothetical protein